MLKYLHSMVRVRDLDKSLDFFVNKLGLVEVRRDDFEKGKFTLVMLATEIGAPEIELTYNWDNNDEYPVGRSFGHLAFSVSNIYETCSDLQAKGVEILRPPRDGRMAFIKTPDGISIEFLQEGDSLDMLEPWVSMGNKGAW